MEDKLEEAFAMVLENWRKMQVSEMEAAEEDAERFEVSFYRWTDLIEAWMKGLNSKPESLDEAMKLPEIEQMIDQLPTPLYINFETELDLIIEEINR